LIAGFSAYSRDLDYAKFREVADEVEQLFGQISLTLLV
jgi:glycine/serine hydroxymethyltransferase